MRFAFFDLDDTLVDTQAALHAWALDFVARYAIEDGDERAAADVVTRRVNDVVTWREFTEKAREWYRISTPADRLFDELAAAYAAKFTISAEVTAGLTRLRDAGWLLAIVTNGLTTVQQGKIERVGLREYVDAVIDSEAAASRKPDRRIFELAAGKLGVELGPDGWMVGDRIDLDIAGGVAVGLRTIWLPQGGVVPQPGDPRPDFTAASIDEAIAIIEGGPAQ
ncbi:MAG TPA: HAD family hydrolase [Actinospica sp.]|jgi:putative hydrolase of the HAD superfamily|nr:HAD family hydrolase [Actinospica sp.]